MELRNALQKLGLAAGARVCVREREKRERERGKGREQSGVVCVVCVLTCRETREEWTSEETQV